MKQSRSLCSATAVLIALGTGAQADVTSAEVWENWKAAAESVGQVLTPGSESQDGGTLTVRDLQMSMEVPDMTMSGTIEVIEFREQPGGTVAITLSPTYDMQFSVAPETGEKIDARLNVDQSQMKITAGGGDGVITYDISAPQVTLAVAEVLIDGEPVEIGGDVIVSDLAANYQMTQGDMPKIASTLTAGRVTLEIDASEPGGDGRFALDAAFADIEATSDGDYAMFGSIEELPKLLRAGYATAGRFTHGPAEYSMDFRDDAEAFQMRGAAESGNFAVSLDADAFSYEIGNTGVSFVMSGSEIPLPEIAASFAEVGFGIRMPLAQSDAPQDFGTYIKLDGLAVSEMIWGMADPSGALPHDPATIRLDIAGTGNWKVDIMDPDSAAAMMGAEMPAELHSLDLNELRLDVAGAELSGTGGFTFDNGNLQTFGGVPAPTGAIDLKLVGGNALIDKLVAMGLIPEEQAMSARMMMGLFARPGDGEDTLTSKIEVDGATGAVSANGQRLQ